MARFAQVIPPILLLIALCTITLGQNKDGQTSVVGSNPASYLNGTTLQLNRSIVLNLNYPALSNGTLNTWSFCYFVLNSAGVSPDISVGMWRPQNDSYYLVNGSFSTLPRSEAFRELDSVCLRHRVPPVDVLVGDVVGASVTAIPAVFSVVGRDQEGQLWTAVGGQETLPEMEFSPLPPGYGLYVEGLDLDSTGREAHSTAPTSTNMGTLDDTAQFESLWAIYAIGILSLLLVALLGVICSLCIALHHRGSKLKKLGGQIELSRTDGNFTSTTHRKSQLDDDQISGNSLPVSQATSTLHQVLQTPVIFDAPKGKRSETFSSFPAPSVRAPSPPQDISLQALSQEHPHQRMLRKTQSNPLKPSFSLPDLLSKETVYESPRQSARTSAMFVPNPGVTTDKLSSVTQPESQNDTNGQTVDKAPEKPYANTRYRARVVRLQSAPGEYADPLSQEMRARFYSYRGMKLEQLGHKIGALKKPMPLPALVSESMDPAAAAAAEDNDAVFENSYTLSSIEVSNDFESTLEKIDEIDEQEVLSRSSSQKRPEVYLEPVQLKTKVKSGHIS